jgi:hypothetical protein
MVARIDMQTFKASLVRFPAIPGLEATSDETDRTIR